MRPPAEPQASQHSHTKKYIDKCLLMLNGLPSAARTRSTKCCSKKQRHIDATTTSSCRCRRSLTSLGNVPLTSRFDFNELLWRNVSSSLIVYRMVTISLSLIPSLLLIRHPPVLRLAVRGHLRFPQELPLEKTGFLSHHLVTIITVI